MCNCFTAFFPGLPGELMQEEKLILDFMVQGEISEADTQHSGWAPLQPVLSVTHLSHPPILRRIPFLLQPSQFILAWDRHQICWLAYSVAWKYTAEVKMAILATTMLCRSGILAQRISKRRSSFLWELGVACYSKKARGNCWVINLSWSCCCRVRVSSAI